MYQIILNTEVPTDFGNSYPFSDLYDYIFPTNIIFLDQYLKDLKRFSPTERFRGKLNITIDFPLEGLDMKPYAADSVTECRYNLYAISNHSGTTYSGHYTAYCKHPYSHAWHEYNDSR